MSEMSWEVAPSIITSFATAALAYLTYKYMNELKKHDKATYAYNYQGNLKTLIDSGGHIYSYEYDSLGRLSKAFNPDSTFKQTQYNDTTNTISVYDENMHKKEYHHDWVGNLLWVKEYIDAQNYYLTQYTYDSVGNLTSITDANGNTTLYEYDSLFGITQIIHPDSTTETLTYDTVGNLLQKADSSGSTTFTYNVIYQLTDIQYPNQSSVTFGYDLSGNRTLMTDSAGSASYSYDNMGCCISQTRTIEGHPYTVSYSYDAASRVISVNYPDQSVINYEYDPLNRLINIPGYAEFTYNADSLLASMTFDNGTVTSYQYDSCHKPTVIEVCRNDTDFLTMHYQYDAAGNITQLDYDRRLVDQTWEQSSKIFQYDWLDRLILAQGDYGSLSYSYDPAGNRLSQNDLTYTYSNMNELLSISDGTVFTYDEMGNTSTKNDGVTSWSYTYDKENLLEQVVKDQKVVGEYIYDGTGKRIQKTEWIQSLQEYHTIIYVYSGFDVVYEKNLNTGEEATYMYGPTGRIAKKVSGLTDYYHTDHLGSIRLKTDESGAVVTDAAYTPFGETLTEQEERFLFAGKEKDASTDLYYFGARYYDPRIGRFLTRDIAMGNHENPQSLNRYSYCRNNPLVYVDPDGRIEKKFVRDVSETTHGNARFIFLIALSFGGTNESGSWRQNQLTDFVNIDATFIGKIQASKGNSKVTFEGALHTYIPWGAGGAGNNQATKLEITIESPEGSIELGSVEIELGDLTEGGLCYLEKKVQEGSIVVFFEYYAYMSEEGSGVVVNVTFSLDSSITVGKDVEITVKITLTGSRSCIDEETMILEADDSLPEGVTIC
ncbi:MAG: hypothetical protein HXS46_18200 [Theionarchaea archaeon]|nr:hypothetical protein [Theionarchaea archaeon]